MVESRKPPQDVIRNQASKRQDYSPVSQPILQMLKLGPKALREGMEVPRDITLSCASVNPRLPGDTIDE